MVEPAEETETEGAAGPGDDAVLITFTDGPASKPGHALLLRRAPIFLRVVIDETDGTVDGLDQLEDTPGPSERVHVYRRLAGVDVVHVCYRGKRKRESGFYAVAEYAWLSDVDGERLRETEAWRAWCSLQAERSAA